MMFYISIEGACSSPELSSILRVCRNILSFIQIVAPLTLLVMTIVNLIKMMTNPEEKKSINKLKNSFFSAIIIFFIPMLINVLMQLMGSSLNISTCWNNVGEYNYNVHYIKINEKDNVGILTDPNSYEHGKPKPTTESGEESSSNPNEVINGTAQQVGDVVWDPTDVTKISNLTISQLIAVLNASGGKARNFIPYASALITAEQKYQVNVFFLLGIEALESGWITSKISLNCNNLGGVRATKSRPSYGCGKNSGGGFAYFNNVGEFIDYHARLLHTSYLTPSGAYYNGKTPEGVVIKYCGGEQSWVNNVKSIANGLFKHVSEVL